MENHFNTMEQLAQEKLRILMVEPGKVPYVSEIPNTLAGQQQAVEGLIEYVYNGDGTIIVVNEEGKLNGMQANRRIEEDVLVGPFFIAGDDGEELRSLSEEEIKKYTERFAEPEDIPQEEVSNHLGFRMMFW